MNDFFDATFATINAQRATMGLAPLTPPPAPNPCPLCAADVLCVDGYHHDNGRLVHCLKYAKPERCDCGKPATYLGLCSSCYHSAQISSREDHSPQRREDD